MYICTHCKYFPERILRFLWLKRTYILLDAPNSKILTGSLLNHTTNLLLMCE